MLLKGQDLPDIEAAAGYAGSQDNKSIANDKIIDIKSFFGYCNEFLIHGKDIDTEKLQKKLLSLGESLILAQADNTVKIHIHSKHPGKILEECLKHGILTDVKVENMDEQHSAVEKKETKKETVIIAVALGEGVKKIFESLGCDYIIKGGQTMNPSVEELNNAIERFEAENYILLPNNGNVIFTAEQTKEINKDKNIIVIPAKSIPQGFSAMLAYNKNMTIKENTANMNSSIKNIKTGEITKAVKDASINKLKIKKNDIIALYNNSVINTYKDTDTAVLELINEMLDKDDEIISLFYGEDIPENKAKKIEKKLNKAYNEMEIEVHHGGQPHYYYIISIE